MASFETATGCEVGVDVARGYRRSRHDLILSMLASAAATDEALSTRSSQTRHQAYLHSQVSSGSSL